MKKCILMAAIATGMLNFASAQNLGVEINFQNPFQHTNFFSNDVSVRYFVADNMAIRGTLNFRSTSNTEEEYNSDDKLFSTDKTNAFSVGLLPGFEYHFANAGKVNAFIGARAGIRFGSNSNDCKYAESSFGTDWSNKRSGFGFQVGAFTGVDYNFVSNLYIGAEIGFDYTSYSLGRGETTMGSTTTKGSFINTTGGLGITVTPTLRIGWKF